MLKRSDSYDRQLLAEIYDQTMDHSDDVDLLLKLIGVEENLRILEPFSGTGRMLLPLLAAGHHVTGIEVAPAMARRARQKAAACNLSSRLHILIRDALGHPWGDGEYDVLVLGANALFELAEQKDQEYCVRLAYQALRPGGYLFLDNNNWTSPLADSVGSAWVALEGTAFDGTYCRQEARTTAADETKGLLFTTRTWYTRTIGGVETVDEYDTVKRPVSGKEVRGWLVEAGFSIAEAFGSFEGAPFTESSERAIFWAQK